MHDVLSSAGQPLDAATRVLMEPKLGQHHIGIHPSGHHIARYGMRASRSTDPDEREADHISEQISPAHGAGAPADSGPDLGQGPEPRATHDFSKVRVHADTTAAYAARALDAAAFTVGEHIVFGANQYDPSTIAGRSLLAHELAHTVQQRGVERPIAQRRLIATGSQADVDSFIDLVAPAIGQDLKRDPLTNEIQAIASRVVPATSPALEGILTTIMNDRVQDAEVNFGTHQVGVSVGAFPTPSDLTGSRVQRIDMDDVLAIEGGAPGNGIAKLAHEISENYHAHAAVPAPGVDLFTDAHEAGLQAESSVAESLVGPGRRVAAAGLTVGDVETRIHDFENYYLMFDRTRHAGGDFTISNVRRVAKNVASVDVIDHFVIDSDALPAAGGAAIAGVAAALAIDTLSTVLVEGFTDSTGTAAHNLDLSRRRAEHARDGLVAAGVDSGRIHIEGRGATRFVASNTAEVDRVRNRRVVITVTRPAP
ncbi:eCIS core domain-containing protein [Monashia sp. NPDC004114]